MKLYNPTFVTRNETLKLSSNLLVCPGTGGGGGDFLLNFPLPPWLVGQLEAHHRILWVAKLKMESQTNFPVSHQNTNWSRKSNNHFISPHITSHCHIKYFPVLPGARDDGGSALRTVSRRGRLRAASGWDPGPPQRSSGWAGTRSRQWWSAPSAWLHHPRWSERSRATSRTEWPPAGVMM